jgi:outer membrane PBP1 activator LpoA protein
MMARFRSLWAGLACVALQAVAQVPAPRQDTPVPPPPPAVALILPGSQTPFAPLAEAVREGFVAARSASTDLIAIQVVEVDATVDAALDAVQSARDRGVRLIVGPLTRDAVNGVVAKGDAGVPIVLLAMPDKAAAIPAGQFALGLSAEDEAAFLVRELLRDPAAPADPAASGQVVVVGTGAFARRTGAALVAALREAGQSPTVLDFPALDAEGIAREIGKTKPAAVLLALDPPDAVQVRTRLPADAPLFATSQINPGSAGGAVVAIDLDGIRFVDLPWMIDPMRGPLAKFDRAPASYDADQQRLYALGIDAYRVASALLRGERRIEFDGATGALRIDLKRSARVERKLAFAVFQDGRVAPLDGLTLASRSDSSPCDTESCSNDLPATKPREPDAAPARR